MSDPPSVTSGGEAPAEVLRLVQESCAPFLGTAKVDKRPLAFDRGSWKLRVSVEPMPRTKLRALEPWERAGTLLQVEALVRIPAVERALHPSLSDKEYARLPFKRDAAIRPTLWGLLSPSIDKHYWRLEEVGGPLRMANRIAAELHALLPILGSLHDLAARAALDAPELRGTDTVADLAAPPMTTTWSCVPAPCLVAAVAFFVAGDPPRAKRAMEAWAARPTNLDARPHVGTVDGVSFAERYAFARKVAALVGAEMPVPSDPG